MELKQIKELMAAMEKAGIKRLRFRDKDQTEVELECKEQYPSPFISAPHPEIHPRFPMHTPPYRGHFIEEKMEEKKEEAKVEGKFITSPMVGTIYHSPSPEDPPFIKVGDKVEEGTIVCIVEAMKVMNEVKAGASGTVAEVLIDNAHPVEFGTKLFRIT